MRIFYSFVFLISSLGFSQVGIGTAEPYATLDVVSTITNNSKDGVLFPKITKQQLQNKLSGTYSSNQNGTIVFVTNVSSNTTGPSISQVEQIIATGYHYFNSTTSKWMPLAYFQDLRFVGTNNHITSDGGFNATGTSAGTGKDNVAIGINSLKSITSSNYNVAIGGNSLSSITNQNQGTVGIGFNTLSKFTGSNPTVAIGHNTLANITAGEYNLGVGPNILTNLETGNQNTSIGFSSLNGLKAGNSNTTLGYRNLLTSTQANQNTVIGSNSAVFVGNQTTNPLSSFNNNTIVGFSVIHANNASGYQLRTKYESNTFLGSEILKQTVQPNLNSIKYNTFLGANTNVEANLDLENLEYVTVIGAGAKAAQSNSIVLGRPKDYVSIGHNKPTNGLHIKSSGTTLDPVRIEGLRTTTASYQYVVIDEDGILKKVAGPASRTIEKTDLKYDNLEKQSFQFNNVTIPINVNNTNQIYNIYSLYSTKIDKSISSSGSKKLNKIQKTELEYHITDYDSDLITDLKINNEGILSYKLINSGDNNVRINILVKEK